MSIDLSLPPGAHGTVGFLLYVRGQIISWVSAAGFTFWPCRMCIVAPAAVVAGVDR